MDTTITGRWCKTTYNNKVQSYYIIARNRNNKYQAVAVPWGRIDCREFDSPEEVFNEIKIHVLQKGWQIEWIELKFNL